MIMINTNNKRLKIKTDANLKTVLTRQLMTKRDLLGMISTKDISLMKDLNDFFSVSPRGKYKYFSTYSYDLQHLYDFLQLLDEDSIYIVIPFISKDGRLNDPSLILSRQILITKYSSIDVIRTYLFNQWVKADDQFNIGDLDNYKLVMYKNLDNQMGYDEGTHNISISIAASITAYARIHMSQFKNNPKINLYYTDTDSAYTDSDIDESLISDKELGKLKLEHECKKAIFLAPKVYCLETVDNKFIYKSKGLKHEVKLTMDDFENLLYKDSIIEKIQTKWMRNLSEGHIKLLEQIYTLKVTDNKRDLIYDENNKLIGTKAYIINKDKDITKPIS
jgi:hypothetical protein